MRPIISSPGCICIRRRAMTPDGAHLRGVSLRCDSAAGRKGPAAYPHVPRIRLTPEAGGFDRLSRGLTHRAMLCSAGRSSYRRLQPPIRRKKLRGRGVDFRGASLT